jgi:hypothetical protein
VHVFVQAKNKKLELYPLVCFLASYYIDFNAQSKIHKSSIIHPYSYHPIASFTLSAASFNTIAEVTFKPESLII